jgi:hypothetical protein
VKEYAIGGELPSEQAKREMEAGRVLTTRDGAERAMIYKKRFATWKTGGNLVNVLNHLVDFTGWYVMEREDFPRREIATKDNTDTRLLNKVMLR